MSNDSGIPPHVICEFANFRLDVRRRMLFAKDDKDPLAVTPKAIAALLLFIEHRGELLTKDQLLRDLWPGRVVEENNLTQVISVLRHALGELPGENRYLVTVPGRGYRFVADVVLHPDTVASSADPEGLAHSMPTARARFRHAAVLAPALGLAVVLLIYGWLAHWRPADDTSAELPPSIGLPSRTIAILPFESLSADDANDYNRPGNRGERAAPASDHTGPYRHRADLIVCLPQSACGCKRHRPSARCPIPGRRQRAALGRTFARDRTTHRRNHRQPPLVASLRPYAG